jgi:ApaG protein
MKKEVNKTEPASKKKKSKVVVPELPLQIEPAMGKSIELVITAKTQYLPEQSSPENHRFLWSYDITIINKSDEIIQLLNRHWRITDMRGKVEEVRGPGVVGLQPLIRVGKEFTYSSYCQLTTPQGTMEGTYEIQTLDEKHFLVDIPKFVLTCPASSSSTFRSKLH